MIAYNFHAVSNGARGEAEDGRWELASSGSRQKPGMVAADHALSRSAEQETIRRLTSAADSATARLLTAVYVALKTYPCLVLSGRAGAGKAALVQHLAQAIVGDAPGQLIRIGSANWATRSGQHDYFRDLHTRFGDSQLSEVLSEAQSPQGTGKLYIVYFDGLAPDELFPLRPPSGSTSYPLPSKGYLLCRYRQTFGLLRPFTIPSSYQRVMPRY
jgi:hypothetical protein